VTAVARLRATERSRLSDRSFAYVDSQGKRRLPIHDASHVRNALARFRQVQFEDEAARERARTRLLQAARKFRIVPIGFIAGELGAADRPSEPDLPSGFVTMLMTDVEDSTALVQRLGPTFAALVDDMWSLLRTAVTDAGGQEVEARADEFFAVFQAPRAAVDAAIEIQRAFARRSFSGDLDVRVRIGVHSGYPTSTVANYVGLDVNTTSRITALGHGGQVVASANTREAVRATNARGVRFVALGDHRLRGIAQPVSLYQVAAKGLPATFPPLRS
jgi:class 3 adenylate cyclase